MIREQQGRLEVSGGMTLAVAARLLAEGNAQVGSRDLVVHLSAAADAVDSAALAVIFGWVRQAKQNGHALTVANPPAQLMSLAELYGVVELLPLAP